MKQLIERTRRFLTTPKAMRILGWIAGGFFVLFIFCLVEMYNFCSVTQFWCFLKLHPKSALLGVLITTALYGTALFSVRKTWIASLIVGVLYQICGFVNILKTDLNGDPFVPMDFTMMDSMGELLSFAKVEMPWWAYVLPLVLAAYIVVLWLWQRELPKGIWYRVAGALILPALLGIFLIPGHAKANFEKFGMYFEDTVLQSSNYRANGFVAGFYLNIATMSVEEPEDYSEEAVTSILSNYEETAAENNPDVIVFLCESYWDVRKLSGVTYSTDPLYFYDELCQRENAYSGTMYSTALGGGTVRTEFDVLTGLTTDYLPSGASPYIYATGAVPTYVSNYKAQGYTTIGMHPYDKTFYSRSSAYGNLGFDVFYGQEEIASMVDESTYERGYFSDDSFVDAIITQLEANEADPTFLFALSMENHQTYYPLEESELDLVAESDVMDEALLGTVNTYAQGVYHSTQALEKLVNYIDSREKETILIFFGDHLPTLGADYAAYAASGLFDGSKYDTDTRKIMYGTPFVIYGNFDLQDGVLQKENNELSTYYLLSAAAVSSGTARTPYMNWLLDQFEETPYYNVRLTMAETDAIAALTNGHRLITYDRLIGKRYTE